MNTPTLGLPIPNTRTTIRTYKPNILISDLSKISHLEQQFIKKNQREPPLLDKQD